MSVNFYGYNVNLNANNTPQKETPKVSKTTIVAGGILTGAGVVTGILTKGKGGKKVVETISKNLPELETKAKKLWGKLTGSAKKEEEIRKAQEEAKKRAEEYARQLEERHKAEQKAIEERKKALEEAQRQREIKRTEELAKKAQAEKAALAARKAQEANRSFKYDTENSLATFIDPKKAIQNDTTMIPNESWESYSARLREKQSKIDVYDFARKIENTEPQTVFSTVAEQLEKCHQNGGTATVEDAIKILENAKSQMSSTVYELKEIDSFGSKHVKTRFDDYNKYVDELIAELKSTNAEGESAPNIVRKAMSNIENRKIAFANARKLAYETATKSYEQQLAPIRERLHYDEASVPPVNKHVTLNPEAKQQLADELNKIIAPGGSNPNFTAKSDLYNMHSTWRAKYISMPFSMQCKEGETAILDMFPRYESRILKLDGERLPFRGAGDFKYEPLYRQMHVENPEEFVKQFENIGGEYRPNRLQSCSKEKYFGECWGGIGNERYGFTEWEPSNNVKFVIHPKGPVSNAADIGEGKYGCFEAIYSADSRFRILGTVKKTVTPEEIQKGLPNFKNQFEDFEKYEIHLQEM